MMSHLDLRAVAIAKTAELPDNGESLDSLARAFIDLGVKSAVTSLEPRVIEIAIDHAYACGATTAQIQEVLTLVSALGVHTLMIASPLLLRAAVARRSHEAASAPLDPEREALWKEKVGADRYWKNFEREVPGFLESLLRLSPETFRAFFDYCAIPWKNGQISAQTKELIALATDATKTHAFEPGFRLHLMNAIKLGASRRAILEALQIANDEKP